MKKKNFMMNAAALILIIAVGVSASPGQEPTNDKRQEAYSGHHESVPETLRQGGTEYPVVMGYFEINKQLENQKELSSLVVDPPVSRLSYIRIVMDLDLYVDVKGDGSIKEPIEEYLPSDPKNISAADEFYVEIAYSPEDRAVMKDGTALSLLFYVKFDSDNKKHWVTATDLQAAGEIYDYEESSQGFSFRIAKWPADDRPIAIGG